MEVTEFSARKKFQQQFSSDDIIFNYQDWEVKKDFSVMGSSKIEHQFDYVLISTTDRNDIVPISVLLGTRQERMDSIVHLYLRSKDLSAGKRFAITSFTVTPYENFLSGIFNVPVVRSVILRNNENFLKITSDGVTRSDIVSHEAGSQAYEKKGVESQESVPYHTERSVRHRRDHTMIVHDILSLARTYGDLGITKIIYKCNLNYRSALRAVSELLDSRLLEISDNGGAKQKYKITPEGLSMLEDIRHISFMKG